jgi:hypothetical protein
MIRGRDTIRAVTGKTPPPRTPEERLVQVGGAGSAGSSGWWGQITSCDYAGGTVGVKPATGTLPNLTVDSEAEEVTAWQGLYGWHVIGDFVLLVSSGSGVTPKWSVVPRPAGLRHYEPISGSDVPTAVTDCAA